ncbi:MAG: hypothetical protein ACI81R_001641 [Bradymonadia bacterium]|jgi:hypothetical protein
MSSFATQLAGDDIRAEAVRAEAVNTRLWPFLLRQAWGKRVARVGWPASCPLNVARRGGSSLTRLAVRLSSNALLVEHRSDCAAYSVFALDRLEEGAHTEMPSPFIADILEVRQ